MTRIVALLRIRNEALIISDTLDHLSQFADAIVCYDDASTDSTFSIIDKHPKVIGIIRNFNWAKEPEKRLELETTHRQALLQLGQRIKPEWFFCADADERYFGDIRQFIDSEAAKEVGVIKFKLFDAYMTPQDHQPYHSGQRLVDFRKYFGPERRDIIMMWRAIDGVYFTGSDSREPVYPEDANVKSVFYCQHYGKALSIEHWEETCDYYYRHFPFDSYGEKWLLRKGKAVHTVSDFDTALYPWGSELFDNAIVIKS